MRKYVLACLFSLTMGMSLPLTAVTPAEALTVNINVGSSLNHGRAITCAQGQRLLQNRGFRDVRRVDCRGRFYVYHARRGGGRFEITINARTGRVSDFRRIRW
ncbi:MULTISPECIES: hypothetical protein [unclassified Mesorhizobium]|jgi:hypothetical protein|uniref:hypothetical protein n=1 Tax=unclassified Mesorhizobium TaxID=325217 RepID=UPI00086E6AAF|nr:MULTISPECIES: hypothetical protein [unclassified Mesorhizobium]MBN9254131.1 hypothetical protein [Mesorhizobium sp.]MBN9273847.1 hypothetical protein [Mesorhizobium sp.]ODT12665.1 MAG: hypothetical protein ABS57_21285 [Mesorhizobium sp. SCN 65-12]OJX71229.1 MAG: hypothetical protein BGO93_17585 [Mesorhizobium sp. 65-26]